MEAALNVYLAARNPFNALISVFFEVPSHYNMIIEHGSSARATMRRQRMRGMRIDLAGEGRRGQARERAGQPADQMGRKK
jgi:hypothetical protein